ncbi:MAG: DUF7263 family protein [Halobacteriota archaeon]
MSRSIEACVRRLTGRRARETGREPLRGQANLVALGVALIVLTTVTVVGVVIADGELARADRDPVERHAAETLADRLVAADANVTVRQNVLDEANAATLTVGELESTTPAVTGRSIRVRLDGQVLVERGNPIHGQTVRRLVRVADVESESRRIDLDSTTEVTVAEPTPSLRLQISPAANTTVETVRVNDRIVLHDEDGLTGTTRLRTPGARNLSVAVETRGTGGPSGSVDVAYPVANETNAVLEVTVGA